MKGLDKVLIMFLNLEKVLPSLFHSKIIVINFIIYH